MKIRPARNLFARDAAYAQKFWPQFVSSGVERRHKYDYFRLTQHTRESIFLLASLALVVILSIQKDSYLSAAAYLSVIYSISFVISGHCKLLMALLAALIPSLWTSIESLEVVVVALLPSYVLLGVISKDSLFCIGSLSLASAGIIWYHSTPIAIVIAPALFLATLGVYLETDFRRVWIWYDSLKRSCSAYFGLFAGSSDAVLITNSKTIVLLANSKARRLLLELGGTLDTELNLHQISQSYGVSTIESFAETVINTGNSVEGDLYFLKKVKGKIETFGSYIVRVEKIPWLNENCVRFSFVSTSSIYLQRQIVINQTNEQLRTLTYVLKDLEDIVSSRNVIRRSDLQSIYELNLSLSHSLTFQMLGVGTVELKLTHFSLQHELIDMIEGTLQKAKDRDLEINLTTSLNLPRIMIGDAQKVSNLMKSILIFAEKIAKYKSTIQLACDVHVRSTQNEGVKSIEIKLSFTFITKKLTIDELTSLFTTKMLCNLAKIKQISDVYGLGIAILPEILKASVGSAINCYICEMSSDRVQISFV